MKTGGFNYNEMSFEKKVRDAIVAVERVLEVERKPRLAGDVDHSYGDKYALVNTTTNTAIIAFMNCMEKIGLTADVLKTIDKTKTTTLRFEAACECKFAREVVVDVPMQRSVEETEETKSSGILGNMTKTKVSKVIQHVKEYHYNLETKWLISIYSGTAVDSQTILKIRTNNMSLITQSNETPDAFKHLRHKITDIPLGWLLDQVNTDAMTIKFQVDVEHTNTKTPRRNDDIEKALAFAGISYTNKVTQGRLSYFTSNILTFFDLLTDAILGAYNPAIPSQDPIIQSIRDGVASPSSIFNPILPLMEDKSDESTESTPTEEEEEEKDSNTVLSKQDMSKLINYHALSLQEALDKVTKSSPPDDSPTAFATAEKSLILLTRHMEDLCHNYSESIIYVESMMTNQLIAAIGKRLTIEDMEKFTTFHNARLLVNAPNPFSHAIRRPEHYPVGLISIESQSGEKKCIQTMSRTVNPGSFLKIPLTAATSLEMTGAQYLHGWMNQRFEANAAFGGRNHYQLVARARQFSSFVLVIGTMNGPATLEPKDAIIIQNKDEVLIPLLLEELPTAKEFKDAIKSLSPEQQRFAKAYRGMQLESSVFGVCVVQIKPQLEALLGLPPDALDKEMQLTQDLMELFVEYQVPSDLLSYNGVAESNVAVEDKISNVKEHVKSVMDVINGEKEKQLKKAALETEMAVEKHIQHSFGSPKGSVGMERFRGGGSSGRTYGAPAPIECFGSPSPAPEMMIMSAPQQERFRSLKAQSPGAKQSLPTAKQSVTPKQSRPEKSSDVVRSTPQKVFGGTEQGSGDSTPHHGVDFTLIPRSLDGVIEMNAEGSALRSTIIKTKDTWVRSRQENLLTKSKKEDLNAEELKKEKNKAFDLLDALSRSGSLPIEYSELHVIVALTHCFDKSVMDTVICDNVNPIEKLELSTLLLGSAIHGVPARELINDSAETARLERAFPLLLKDDDTEIQEVGQD